MKTQTSNNSVITGDNKPASPESIAEFIRRPQSRVKLSVAVTAALCVNSIGDAFAQTTPSQAVALEEVVVTAQKREESSQDVPVAISAFSANMLENGGIRTSEDLGLLVPSLVFNSTQNGGSMYMRGIGTKDTQPSGEPLVAMYVDGFYYQSFEAGLFNFSNIERIEILRGPQGTLYGRNATAGLVHLITRDPTDGNALNLELGVGNYNKRTVNLYGAAGLSETLAADLSVYHEKHDGWGDNLTTGEETNHRDNFALRSKWVWDASDTTRATLAYDYSRLEGDIGNSGYLAPGTVAADGSVLDYSPYDTTRDVSASGANSDSWGVGIKIEHDLGWAAFNSLTSYRQQESFFTVDPDNTGARTVGVYINSVTDAFMQELQLISEVGEKFDWSTGLFYQYAGGGPTPISVILHFLNDTPLYEGRVASAYTASLAAYFQGTWHLTNKLNTTFGLRYTQDKQEREVAGGGLNYSKDSETWREPTYRLSLDYAFSEAAMGYVSYNRGYKNGRFSVTAVTAPPVDPEIVDSYEIGMKSQWFDNRARLNANVFYSDYQNLQVEVVVPPNPVPETINAAAATIVGLEIDAQALVTDNLSFTAGLTYLAKSEYDSFEGAQVVIPAESGLGNQTVTMDLSGADLRFSPELVYTIGANYSIQTQAGNWNFNLNFRHSDDYLVEDALISTGYDVLNTSLGWTSPSERWGVKLWANNLTDELYNLGSNQDGFAYTLMPAAPRTYGVNFSFNF